MMSLPSGMHPHCLHQDLFDFFTIFTLLAAGWCCRGSCSHGTPEANTQAFPLCQNIAHPFGMIVRIFNTRFLMIFALGLQGGVRSDMHSSTIKAVPATLLGDLTVWAWPRLEHRKQGTKVKSHGNPAKPLAANS